MHVRVCVEDVSVPLSIAKPQNDETQGESLNFVSKFGFKMEGKNRKWRSAREERIEVGQKN